MSLDDLKAMLQKAAGIEMPQYSIQGDTVTVSKICSLTGERYSVELPLPAYEAWRNGALIQRAFPQLSGQQREFLLSGNTPAEWNRIFGQR